MTAASFLIVLMLREVQKNKRIQDFFFFFLNELHSSTSELDVAGNQPIERIDAVLVSGTRLR